MMYDGNSQRGAKFAKIFLKIKKKQPITKMTRCNFQ